MEYDLNFLYYNLLNYIENDDKAPLFSKDIWNHYNDDNFFKSTDNH